jgi:hypothetical protein
MVGDPDRTRFLKGNVRVGGDSPGTQDSPLGWLSECPGGDFSPIDAEFYKILAS